MKKILVGGGKQSAKTLINNIIQMFLSLDLDMQTLEVLRQNGGDMEKFLREMYSDDIDYFQKVNNLQSDIRKLDEIEEIDKEKIKIIYNLMDDVINFLQQLARKEKNLLGHIWVTDEVNSFHNWYCALVKALRGGEADE